MGLVVLIKEFVVNELEELNKLLTDNGYTIVKFEDRPRGRSSYILGDEMPTREFHLTLIKRDQ